LNLLKPYSLRFAVHAELPAIVEIYNSTVASRMVTADTEPITVASREAWFAAHTPEKYPLWVLFRQDTPEEICGFMSFSAFYGRPAYSGTAEISIYLAETVRGSGLGKELLAYAENFAPQVNIHTLLGFIFGHNAPSVQLFQRCGYACWGHLPEVAILDGTPRDLMIFGKKVNSFE
jgi:phosphinothricin acetyltransferase